MREGLEPRETRTFSTEKKALFEEFKLGQYDFPRRKIEIDYADHCCFIRNREY